MHMPQDSLKTHNLQIHINDILRNNDLMQSHILRLQQIYLKEPILLQKLEDI